MAGQPLSASPAAGWGLPPDLAAWLDQHADALDDGSLDAATVLPRLAGAGLFRIGVPVAQGGSPASSGAIQASANTVFGLRSRYSMKTRWLQATKALATDRSAT